MLAGRRFRLGKNFVWTGRPNGSPVSLGTIIVRYLPNESRRNERAKPIARKGSGPPNNGIQLTALRAAADTARWAALEPYVREEPD
jgi:hypothetical protein